MSKIVQSFRTAILPQNEYHLSMRNLTLNVSTEEIAKIVKEEKSGMEREYHQAINLALISEGEKYNLTRSQKINDFYSNNQDNAMNSKISYMKKLRSAILNTKMILKGMMDFYYGIGLKKWVIHLKSSGK